MSNARSPREVCSTTIGIRGLMQASLRLQDGDPPVPVQPEAVAIVVYVIFVIRST